MKERALAYLAEQEEPGMVAQAGAKLSVFVAVICGLGVFVGLMRVAATLDDD